jgi:phenylacetate-CoA ligase
MVRNIQKFQPGFLGGYPSAAYLLGLYVQEQGITNLKLTAVMTGGEQLFDYQRELIFKVFKCETFSYYSSWEVQSIAGECAQHTGLHIPAEDLIVEIADKSGNPVPAGVEGRILITNLHNYGMPFIRYDIGDTGALSEAGCPCGRNGLPLLVNLNGRADAILLTKSGKRIPGRGIPQRFLADLGVQQYQIVQESYEEIIMSLVLDKEYPEEHKVRVIQEIDAFYQPLLGKEIAVKVQFEKEIPPARTGKREVFISKLKYQ